MPRPAAVLAIVLLILLFEISSGQVGRAEGGRRTTSIANKIHSRKTLVDVMDYDYGGHNTRNDPKRGKPGSGGKNP